MSKFAILSLCAGLGLFVVACAGPVGNQPIVSANTATPYSAEAFAELAAPAPAATAKTQVQNFVSINPDYQIEVFSPFITQVPTLEELQVGINSDGSNEALISANGGVIPTGPSAAPTSQEQVESGNALIAEGKLSEARDAFTKALHGWDLKPSIEQEVVARLDELNRQLFLSTAQGGDMEKYQVVRGDSLNRIAAKYHTTWEFLRRLNGLERTTIYVGQSLIVPKYRFGVIIKKDRFSLDLTYNGAFIKRYRIGTGIADSTPEGTFSVMSRIEHPDDNGHKFGTAEHTLGSHWLGLKSEAGYQGYGIHGTRPSETAQLGGECTQGSVRLSNEEVEELFDLLPVGSVITIQA